MGRINSYTNITRPSTSDEILIDGTTGTHNVTMGNLAIELAGMVSSEQHRNIWRGKNLGGTVTDVQKVSIQNGKFDDLYIGDYWTINGHLYRIVDMDYWYGQGDKNCDKHHLVIMPDGQLYTNIMNVSDTTDGGYLGSKMYLEGLREAKTVINTAFGSSNVLNHREYLTNAVTDGHPSAGAWFDSTVELPNEIMMYGSRICGVSNNVQPHTNTVTLDNTQLAAMRLRPSTINPRRQAQWLRDIGSDRSFVLISSDGSATSGIASLEIGVRPVFGITGN